MRPPRISRPDRARVQSVVFETHGVELQREVRIIGEVGTVKPAENQVSVAQGACRERAQAAIRAQPASPPGDHRAGSGRNYDAHSACGGHGQAAAAGGIPDRGTAAGRRVQPPGSCRSAAHHRRRTGGQLLFSGPGAHRTNRGSPSLGAPGQCTPLLAEQSERDHRGTTPVARWGENEWLNDRAEVVQLGDAVVIDGLVSLSGPDSSAADVWHRYNEWAPMLREVGLEVDID